MATNKQPNNEQIVRSSKYYSEEGFWEKVAKVAKSAGLEVIYKALLLFYTAIAPSTPIGERALIFGALGYFILPVDLIPDLIPVVGYTDDLAALGSIIALVSKNINSTIKQSAKEQLRRWFKDVEDSKIDKLN